MDGSQPVRHLQISSPANKKPADDPTVMSTNFRVGMLLHNLETTPAINNAKRIHQNVSEYGPKNT